MIRHIVCSWLAKAVLDQPFGVLQGSRNKRSLLKELWEYIMFLKLNSDIADSLNNNLARHRYFISLQFGGTPIQQE